MKKALLSAVLYNFARPPAQTYTTLLHYKCVKLGHLIHFAVLTHVLQSKPPEKLQTHNMCYSTQHMTRCIRVKLLLMVRKMMDDDDDDVYLYEVFHIPGSSSSSHPLRGNSPLHPARSFTVIYYYTVQVLVPSSSSSTSAMCAPPTASTLQDFSPHLLLPSPLSDNLIIWVWSPKYFLYSYYTHMYTEHFLPLRRCKQ